MPSQTPLFSRQQSGGVLSFVDVPAHPGNIWWVNSATGTNSAGYGQNPDAPFASLDYAVSRVTNANGDTIYLMPGHTETLTAAGSSLGNGGVFIGSVLSNSINIIGLGNGRYRPVFNYTTSAAASMNIAAAGVRIKNCVFTPNGVGAVTAAINVTGADFVMEDCEMQISTGTNACVLGILTAATAARMKILNTRFLGPATSTQTCTAAIKHEVGIDYVIQDCEFIGKLTSGILNATAILGGLVNRCSFHIYTGTLGAIFHNSSTPHVSNCNFVVASGTAPMSGTLVSATNNKYTTEGIGLSAGTALTF